MTTVGVTGTNGKTSTTTLVAAALRTVQSRVVRVTTIGRYVDDEVLDVGPGYPGFLETFRRAHERGGRFGAIELTSEALAMGFALAWPCRVGVFTNLSRDHLDAHGSAEHYLASKAQLFVHLPPGGSAVLNARDSASELLTNVVPSGVAISSYGVASRGDAWCKADLEATSVMPSWNGTTMDLEWSADSRPPHAPDRMHVAAIGEPFAENALAALLAAIAMGVEATEAADAIAACATPRGRFELIARSPFVVVDYAHTPDALARTLGTARTLLRGDGRVVAVFGAGGERDHGKRRGMGEAAGRADAVILTSDNPRSESPGTIAKEIMAGVPKGTDVDIEVDRARAIGRAIEKARVEDVIVIAGKGHERTQMVDGEDLPFSDAEIARGAHARR